MQLDKRNGERTKLTDPEFLKRENGRIKKYHVQRSQMTKKQFMKARERSRDSMRLSRAKRMKSDGNFSTDDSLDSPRPRPNTSSIDEVTDGPCDSTTPYILPSTPGTRYTFREKIL